MFPSEMIILMAIAVASNSNGKLLIGSMDVTGEYIGYLYNSLVTRGYLKKNKSRGYKLTPRGRQTLSEFLQANVSKAKDIIRTLQQLGIGSNQEIEQLRREAIRVRG